MGKTLEWWQCLKRYNYCFLMCYDVLKFGNIYKANIGVTIYYDIQTNLGRNCDCI